jgi:GrpB-like predicted nucleotidyltransferase (UPF0157 family)
MPAPLGLEPGIVRVVEYDARWPGLFAAEASRIASVIQPLTLVLEHVGSTAVPGLAAKPIVDILAAFPAGDPVSRHIAGLCAAGYEHRGDQGIPGREFFRRGQPRAYHVHLTVAGSSFSRDHLDFRNRLRSDPECRAAYGRLKRELAAKYPRDREAYIEGKSAFVLTALSEWRARVDT